MFTATGTDGGVQVAITNPTQGATYLYRWRRTDHPPPPPLQTQTGASWGLARVSRPANSGDSAYRYDWTGEGVRVYTLEVGMRYTHDEFTGRTIPGATFYPGGVHDQDNGSSHGTAVASLIAGTRFGVAKKALIGNLRPRPGGGVPFSPVQEMIDALAWIRANHPAGTPGVILLAAPGNYAGNPGYGDVLAAWEQTLDAGFHVVMAASYGGSNPYEYEIPGYLSRAFLVSMTDYADDGTAGATDRQADIWAPGEGLQAGDITSNSASQDFGGTSASGPLVAGALALLLEPNPHLTPARAHEVLISQASRVVVGLPDGLRPMLNTRATTADWSQGPMGMSATIDGLEPGSTYEVSVASVEGGQASGWSTPIGVTTGGGGAMYLGSLPVRGMYIGSTPVARAYLGSTLVWERAGDDPPPTPSIPQVVGTSTGGRSGTGTFTVPLPPGAQGYVAVLRAEGATSTTAPSGWTQVDAGNGSRRLYYASSSSPGTEWGRTEGGASAIVVVGYSTPVVLSQLATATSLNSPSITTTQPGLILRAVLDLPDAPYGITYPPNAPLGRAYSIGETTSGYGALVAVAHSEQETPGATGTAAWNYPDVWQPVGWTALVSIGAPDPPQTTKAPPPAGVLLAGVQLLDDRDEAAAGERAHGKSHPFVRGL